MSRGRRAGRAETARCFSQARARTRKKIRGRDGRAALSPHTRGSPFVFLCAPPLSPLPPAHHAAPRPVRHHQQHGCPHCRPRPPPAPRRPASSRCREEGGAAGRPADGGPPRRLVARPVLDGGPHGRQHGCQPGGGPHGLAQGVCVCEGQPRGAGRGVETKKQKSAAAYPPLSPPQTSPSLFSTPPLTPPLPLPPKTRPPAPRPKRSPSRKSSGRGAPWT
jgi:hypothetical protein